MLNDQIVAKELAITFYGSRSWGKMTERQKSQAMKDCLLESQRLQQDMRIVFSTILRLRQGIDTSDPAV